MASTLPLTDDGDITQNSETPNDGKYKLQNAATGSGNKLTIEGSNAAASSNGNGGDITLVPGTLDGSGANGKVDVEGELYLKTYSKIG
ncbi:MAG: hypothetical protein JNL74_10825, partial [Fibrobacteres bacterium]|nr:hypothetical protein [Fibrobacterota bacterium]